MVYRIDEPTAVKTQPVPPPAGEGGYFTGGNPATGEPATIVAAWWLTMIQEELVSVCREAGIDLSKTDNTQLSQAIIKLIADKIGKPEELFLALKGGQMTGQIILPDNNGKDPRIAINQRFADKRYLALTGGTVTGEVDIQGEASDGPDEVQYGGIIASAVEGMAERASLQLQGKNSALAPVVVFFDGNGWKTWRFDPASGEITDPNGQALATKTGVTNSARATQDWAKNNFLQLPAGSPPLKIQAFSVTGGANNGAPRITFPEAFSKTLSVSAIVNQTPGSHNSRTVNILPSAMNVNDMQMDNSGFTCQIFYTLGGGGAGTTGDPWTMLVTAIGVA